MEHKLLAAGLVGLLVAGAVRHRRRHIRHAFAGLSEDEARAKVAERLKRHISAEKADQIAGRVVARMRRRGLLDVEPTPAPAADSPASA